MDENFPELLDGFQQRLFWMSLPNEVRSPLQQNAMLLEW